jgi:hypothetical protein
MLEGGHDTSRDRWLCDRDVRAVAEAVVAGNHAQLVSWANEATASDMRGNLDDAFALIRDPTILACARRIASAGARINTSRDFGNLRGAVLELIVTKLVARHGATPISEQRVRLNHLRPAGITNPIEVVADGDPFEAYECKASAELLEPEDLIQLDAIRRSATAEGRSTAVGVATFGSSSALERRIRTMAVPKGLKHLCRDDLLELGDAPARRPLAQVMSGHW